MIISSRCKIFLSSMARRIQIISFTADTFGHNVHKR